MDKNKDLLNNLISTLEQNTRGVQIGIYSIATIGLSIAIHKVRPVSKFSRPIDIPKHFIRNKEPLKGRIVGYETSKSYCKILFDHHPLIWIPFWHSSKAPLCVQVWGIQPIGNNVLSWLQCVATGCEATIIPLTLKDNSLFVQMTVHLPIASNRSDNVVKKKKWMKRHKTEDIDIGERLVELGMGKVTEEIKQHQPHDNWWMPWIKSNDIAVILQQAQNRAISYNVGFWQEIHSPTYIQRLYSLFNTFLKKVTFKKTSISIT